MLNQIALVGRLTREPELLTANTGTPITKFALAFNQGKNPDGTEDTGFIEVSTFETLANTCGEWLSKGDKIAVTGRIIQKRFTRKDGSKGSNIELIASSVEFIDILKQNNEDEDEEEEDLGYVQSHNPEPDEELPFEPDPEVKVSIPEPQKPQKGVPQKATPQNAKPVAKPTRTRR